MAPVRSGPVRQTSTHEVLATTQARGRHPVIPRNHGTPARPFAGRDAFGERDCAVRRMRSETGLASTF